MRSSRQSSGRRCQRAISGRLQIRQRQVEVAELAAVIATSEGAEGRRSSLEQNMAERKRQAESAGTIAGVLLLGVVGF
jgi:hypothetical protein